MGDGNNVLHSLLFGGAKMGMHVVAATPVGYDPLPEVVQQATQEAARTGAQCNSSETRTKPFRAQM